MASFETGISSYVHAQAVVDVYFPVDSRGNEEIACRHCYYFAGEGSNRCRLNWEICQYPNKYVGGSCPLHRIDDDTGEIENI